MNILCMNVSLPMRKAKGNYGRTRNLKENADESEGDASTKRIWRVRD